MPPNPSDWAPLQPILQNILLEHTDGISEYALFKILQSAPYQLFEAEDLQDPLRLFQSHFIVFNALYHIREKWLSDHLGLLHIGCIRIRLAPWQSGQEGLVQQDKLRTYYLNWQHLADTDQQQVESLLDRFWLKFAGLAPAESNNSMSLQQALELLSLESPYSAQQLKQQYRKMLHRHHPDKGGENDHTGLLHQAYQRLK
nr:DNA-J related domain-containing protein [Alteromonadaceae bacterium BrNp21-10]